VAHTRGWASSGPRVLGQECGLGDDTNTQLSRNLARRARRGPVDANDPNATSSPQSTLWASKALAASGQNRLLPRACTTFWYSWRLLPVLPPMPVHRRRTGCRLTACWTRAEP